MSLTGAVIGALAGATAVLMYRLTNKDKGKPDGENTDGSANKVSRPVRIKYKFGGKNETDNSKQ